ncbi:pyruvate dehydrogenase (acetyl-transferring) E1 component subunit alpha [Rathayibacter toxicus]|uniref:thiamine pyrophosphate-dependent enzyme n=1 Tax=Rathayibacter toxicus TaxID=145458 RepID=UPI001C04A652|nr:thiamine pyrophosphate-dependent enzyme [Rathayibacter toxicus]QWL28402.1 pyruvate dehydrogenase (acetyl-transferring) E1 component subunit alpha [Rathayibacter toxicus]
MTLDSLTKVCAASREQILGEELLLRAHTAMVAGRHFDQQATNLAKQGYLMAYPSSLGQEACQVAAALALEPRDWLFPTYRDSVAVLTRGIAPDEVLTLFQGSWHCGYDSVKTRTAPHSAPLATHLAHAVGAAMAAKLENDGTLALALVGDGATSEGDFHEALNLAAVFTAPVVFLVQNNGYAISLPVAKQLRAETIASKGVGYGITAFTVDGNNFGELYACLSGAVERARAGGGPTLVEAVTYRMAPHTNFDDPDRYRSRQELDQWKKHDPIMQIRSELDGLDSDLSATIAESERHGVFLAHETRDRVSRLTTPGPHELFEHVYAQKPASFAARSANYLAQIEGEE